MQHNTAKLKIQIIPHQRLSMRFQSEEPFQFVLLQATTHIIAS
jgi:hypothetical protein